MRKQYFGVLDGYPGVYGVVVPDITGCCGGGATIDAAIEDAAGALDVIVKLMRAVGEAVPEPSSLDAMRAAYDGSAIVSLGLLDPLNQTVFQLNDEAWDELQAALANPPRANAALKKLMRSVPVWDREPPQKAKK